MFSEQDTLITILKDSIKYYEAEREKRNIQNKSIVEKYEKNLQLLEKSIENIVSIPLEDLAEVIYEAELSEEDRELEYNCIKTIRSMLKLNQTKKTTFQLSETQENYVIEWKIQLQNIYEKTKWNENRLLSITQKLKELKVLLETLVNKNNNDFFNQIGTINDLFQVAEIEEKTQRSILYDIIRYNQENYHKKLEVGKVAEMNPTNV